MKQLYHKIKEALIAVLPITAIVVIVNFLISPMPTYNFLSFIVGAVLLIFGMGLYQLGVEVAIEPIGGHIGSRITRTKKLGIILPICFIIGVIVTIAEPDLKVLADQVPTIDSWTLIITIAVGVGLFLLLAVLRIALKVPLRYLLIVFYLAVFVLAAFVSAEFVPLAFDSGGVTTGPITVPFIMALGVGVSSVLGGKESQDSSFGLIGICSIGPILAVLILGLLYSAKGEAGVDHMIPIDSVGAVFKQYLNAFPHYLEEVGIALLPIIAFFFIFQAIALKLPKIEIGRIVFGSIYTYLGLAIFLTGVNVGFMPAGSFLGAEIALSNKWLLIPIGLIVGAFIVLAEPAVHVLAKQVEEITDGTINRKTMLVVMAFAIACAVGLAMLRVATGISIWWVVIPGYAFALILSFFVPKIFTAVAFDSGGVASGPMTATFLLPLALGAADALEGANLLTDAFGLVALVAMMPLVAVQLFGLIYQLHLNRENKRVDLDRRKMLESEGDVIIDLESEEDSSFNITQKEKEISEPTQERIGGGEEHV